MIIDQYNTSTPNIQPTLYIMSTSQETEVTLEKALNIASVHMNQQNYRVAELVLTDILKAYPDEENAHYMLGLAYYFIGDLNKAYTHLATAIKNGQETPAEWYCNYGIISHQAGHPSVSIDAFDQGIKADPSYANSYWNKSHILWLEERYQEAEEAARQGIKVDDSVPEAWINLGTALVKQDDRNQEALEAWEKALTLAPDMPEIWNNMGNLLRDMGQLEAAIEKCRKALDLNPNYAEALSNLANAMFDLGDTDEAEATYKRAIDLKPDYVEAHNNLAICHIYQSRFDEGIKEARIALSYNPNHSQALLNLSICYRSLGQIEEAEKAVAKAALVTPDSPEIHIELADTLFMQDRYAEAEVELEKAKELKPDSPRVYIRLANTYERGNKIEQALEAIDKAVELNPEMMEAYLRKGSICHISNRIPEAKEHFAKALERKPDSLPALMALADLHLSIGEIEEAKDYIEKVRQVPNHETPALFYIIGKTKKYTSIDDPDFQKMLEMEAHIERSGIDQASVLHYALFDAYENIGDNAKAFEHLAKGNEYKRRSVPYDAEQQSKNFANIRKKYTTSVIDSFKDKGCQSKTPIFIVGMPRSGTTLTEQIISSHPQIHGAGELMELSMLDFQFGPINDQNAKDQGQWYVDRVEKLAKSTPNALHVSDKMPGNFSHLGKILSILPNAKIIHCRRNPIDTCLSCFKQNFARGQYWSYNLEELADYYNMYLEMMEYWREQIGDRFIEVDYEETVSDLETQARRMIDFIGLEWDEACLTPHKQKRAILTASKMQVIKPVYKSSVKSWQKYESELSPLIDGLSKGKAKDLLDL